MKKLIPALILLLVSAMVLSTSSYAWFSMNRTVSATGMSLTSTAPANLLITNGAETPTWGATVLSNETYTGKIFPASSADGLTFFAIADGQKIGAGDIGGVVAGTGSAVTGGVVFYKSSAAYSATVPNAPVNKLAQSDADATGYWAEYTLKLKTTGSSALNVYLSSIDITTTYTYTAVHVAADTDLTTYFTDTNGTAGTGTAGVGGADVYTRTANTIDDCVRVSIYDVTHSTLVGIYDAGTTKNSVNPITTVVYDDKGTAGDVSDDTFTSYTASTTDAAKITGTDANGFVSTDRTFVVSGSEVVTELRVRVWIEGQNSNCINSIAGQNFNIGLTFNIAAA
jgi:hypothetical protein